MAQLLSDADVGLGSPAFLSDEDVGIAPAKPNPGGLGNLGYSGQIVSGMPIIGPLFQKGVAAANAAIEPFVGDRANETFSQRYGENLESQKAAEGQFATEHPAGSFAANLLGGALTLGPVAETGIGARLLGVGPGGLLGNTVRGGISGAALGGANAELSGEDPTQGAKWGGIFGAAAPAAGKFIGKVASGILQPTNTAEQIALQKVAAPLVSEGLTTPQAVTQKLQGIGPEAMPLDINSNLTQMGGVIASSPGEGQQVLRQAVADREAQSGERIVADIDRTMGQPVDLDQLSKDIYSQAKAKAGPLYSSAYNVPVNSSPELEGVLNSPLGQRAMNSAKRLSLSDPTAPPSTMFQERSPVTTVTVPEGSANLVGQLRGQGLSEPEIAKFTGLPTTETAQPPAVDARGLHLVRQAYDDMIGAAQRQGASNQARILNAQRAIIDDSLKSIPQFAQADSIYADMSRIRDAMDVGTQIFTPKQTPESVAAAFAGMSDAERQAYLQGGRVAVRNIMGTARNDAAAARGLFSKEFNQEKLRLLLGEDGSNAVLNRIGAEHTYNASAQRILRNSETAARLQGKADLENAHGLPSYQDVAIFSGTHGVAKRAIFGLVKSTLNAIASGKQQKIETNIARLLTVQGPEREAALQKIMAVATKKSPKLANAITLLISRVPQHDAQNDQRAMPQ